MGLGQIPNLLKLVILMSYNDTCYFCHCPLDKFPSNPSHCIIRNLLEAMLLIGYS